MQSVFFKFQLYEFGLSIVKFLDLCQQHWTMPVVVFYALHNVLDLVTAVWTF